MNPSLTIAPGFEDLLDRAGLDRFDRVMAAEAAAEAVMRAVPGRSTVRLTLPPAGPGEPAPVVYLKRHRGRWRAGAAAREWRRLAEVSAAGVPCPRPVAWGEKRGLLGPRESFLMTEEIPAGRQADWWIAENPARRGALVAGVAGLARRFHAAGFHHQDLYLCHFFVRAREGGAAGRGLDLFLIDLQRCGLHRGRRRWIVKDLAQLHHSLAVSGFSPADWEEFLRAYGDVGPALGRAVLAKSRRIARHVPKHG